MWESPPQEHPSSFLPMKPPVGSKAFENINFKFKDKMSNSVMCVAVANTLITTNKDGSPKLDKHNLRPIRFTVLAGPMQYRAGVLSGTIAMRAGFVDGKRYLLAIAEDGVDPVHGTNYNVANGGEVTPMEAIQMASPENLGAGTVLGAPAKDEEPKVKLKDKAKKLKKKKLQNVALEEDEDEDDEA